MNNSELKKGIKDKNVILFVGAGISATLGLPTWNDLVAKMGDDLGFDADLFQQYGDNLILAEYYSLIKGALENYVVGWMKIGRYQKLILKSHPFTRQL